MRHSFAFCRDVCMHRLSTRRPGGNPREKQISIVAGPRTRCRLRRHLDDPNCHAETKRPYGARDEFLLAATAQDLSKPAKLIRVPSFQPARTKPRSASHRVLSSAPDRLRFTAGGFQHNRPTVDFERR